MIPERNPYNNWSGNGSTTTFDFDFYIENATQLAVYHTDVDGVQTTLRYGIDYSIHELQNENGSYITFPIAGSSYSTLADGEVISLCLTLPISQENEYGQSSYLNLTTLEYSLDYLTRLIQIINRQVARSAKVPEGSDIDADDLNVNIIKVGESIDNVDSVASDLANIDTVAGDLTNIDTVAGSIANVNAVGADIANVNSVAADLANIDTVAGDLTNIDTVAGSIANVNTVGSNISKVNSVASNIGSVNTAASNISSIINAPTYAQNAADSANAAQNAANRAEMYASDITSGGFIWTPVAVADWTLNSTTGKYEKTISVVDVPAIVAAYKGVWNNKEVVDVDIVSSGTSHKIISYDAFDGFILGSITVLQSEYDDYAVVSAMAAMEEAKDWASKTSGKVDEDSYSAKYYAQAASSSAATATAAASSQNITTIINNMSDIDTVASSSTNINTVASNISNVNSVASNSSNITSVAGSISNVNSVAGDLTNIDAVAGDLTNIDAASSNASLASEWACKMDGKVNNEDYSAKYYASQAAQGQVQSDWTEADSTSKAYILNKPTIPAAQIQSDWNQANNTALDYIKNKPTIPTVPATLSSFTDDLGTNPTHTHSQYIKTYTFNNSALTPTNGKCSWDIIHTINSTNIQCSLVEISTGKNVVHNFKTNSTTSVTIEFLANTAIGADTYKVILIG